MRGRGVQGGCATQRQNYESTVTVPLGSGVRPGSPRRRNSQPRKGVLLQIALLARWCPDDEDRKQLLLVDGTIRPTRPDPTIHTPHEPPLDLQRKRSSDDRRARRTRGTRPRRVLREQRGWHRGRQGMPLALLTQEPKDGGCPHRSTGRRARRQESRGVAITVSRTTFASRPLTKVPAPPRGRRCDTEHDDPELQPADLLRRHTEQQKINVIPSKTAVAVHRTRIARKCGARQTTFLAHLRSVLFQNQCAVRCHRMSPKETTLNMPVKKIPEEDSVQKPPRQHL